MKPSLLSIKYYTVTTIFSATLTAPDTLSPYSVTASLFFTMLCMTVKTSK